MTAPLRYPRRFNVRVTDQVGELLDKAAGETQPAVLAREILSNVLTHPKSKQLINKLKEGKTL